MPSKAKRIIMFLIIYFWEREEKVIRKLVLCLSLFDLWFIYMNVFRHIATMARHCWHKTSVVRPSVACRRVLKVSTVFSFT